jgi:murein DD-endopeptidase MepM/ murein hydrolase activator NlpD
VRRGQPVGAVGMTGRATGPHLHWSLRWRDAKLDPLLVAGAMR